MTPEKYLENLLKDMYEKTLTLSEQIEFSEWKEDSTYDLIGSKSLIRCGEMQEMIWEIKRLRTESEELNLYKKTLESVKKFFFEE